MGEESGDVTPEERLRSAVNSNGPAKAGWDLDAVGAGAGTRLETSEEAWPLSPRL